MRGSQKSVLAVPRVACQAQCIGRWIASRHLGPPAVHECGEVFHGIAQRAGRPEDHHLLIGSLTHGSQPHPDLPLDLREEITYRNLFRVDQDLLLQPHVPGQDRIGSTAAGGTEAC